MSLWSDSQAFVYEPEDEAGVIVTEWPNGVIDGSVSGI